MKGGFSVWQKFLIVLAVLIVSQKQILRKGIHIIQNARAKIVLVGNTVYVGLVPNNYELKSLNLVTL
jgi:adenosyl cobinamide kinase/adenosyl cobinamide phosphate guanylyltransferase